MLLLAAVAALVQLVVTVYLASFVLLSLSMDRKLHLLQLLGWMVTGAGVLPLLGRYLGKFLIPQHPALVLWVPAGCGALVVLATLAGGVLRATGSAQPREGLRGVVTLKQ